MHKYNPYMQPGAEEVCSWGGYLYFVHEREAIRLKREAGLPAPWTNDPVLQKYKFTNIRRRDDRLSKWIEANLILAGRNRESSDLWFTLLIGRLINWPPTLQALIDAGVLPCSPETFNEELFVSTIESLPGKRYGGAYMLYPAMKDPGGVKSRAVARHIIGDVIRHRVVINTALWGAEAPATIERFVAALAQCFGISTFMAGQAANDLTWAWGHLDDALDIRTWAPRGPGSQKGLNYMLGIPLAHVWQSDAFCAALRDAGTRVVERLGIDDLTLHDVQNTFCEYSKYARTVLGEGKPKSLYKPETVY
jgi:hypothetical protein